MTPQLNLLDQVLVLPHTQIKSDVSISQSLEDYFKSVYFSIRLRINVLDLKLYTNVKRTTGSQQTFITNTGDTSLYHLFLGGRFTYNTRVAEALATGDPYLKTV